MKRTTVRRAVALLFAGFGLTAAVVYSPARSGCAEPVPLVKPGKPIVSIAAVREAAPIDGTVRAAPDLSPPALFDSGERAGLPIVAPFPGEPTPRMDSSFETFPRREGGMPISTSAFDPFGGSTGRNLDPRAAQPNPGGVRGIWNGVAKWTTDKAKSLTDAVAGPSQQPDPRVGQFPQPLPVGQPVPMSFGAPPPQGMPMQPFRGVTAGGRAAYAGNPAYRWYGWGTTTPGANPYAPTGEYPNSSAQWYAMSGATPGAFPVPVTNPFRPEPGSGAPAYVSNIVTDSSAPSVPPPAFAVSTGPIVPDGPKPIVESTPFRYVPPDELSTTSSVVPGVPPAPLNWRGREPVPTKVDEFPARPAKVEPAWQPIGQAAPTKAATMFVGQALPRPSVQSEILQVVATEPVTPQTLQERIATAAGAGVKHLEVKILGRDNVVVRFDAPSDSVAESAAKAIAQLAELKPYTVTFDVAVER